jgi:hypothetical protein
LPTPPASLNTGWTFRPLPENFNPGWCYQIGAGYVWLADNSIQGEGDSYTYLSHEAIGQIITVEYAGFYEELQLPDQCGQMVKGRK